VLKTIAPPLRFREGVVVWYYGHITLLAAGAESYDRVGIATIRINRGGSRMGRKRAVSRSSATTSALCTLVHRSGCDVRGKVRRSLVLAAHGDLAGPLHETKERLFTV